MFAEETLLFPKDQFIKHTLIKERNNCAIPFRHTEPQLPLKDLSGLPFFRLGGTYMMLY